MFTKERKKVRVLKYSSKNAEIALLVWVSRLKKRGATINPKEFKKLAVKGAKELGVPIQDMVGFAKFSLGVLIHETEKKLDSLLPPKK